MPRALDEQSHLVASSSAAAGVGHSIDATSLDLRNDTVTRAIRQPDTPFNSKSAISALRFHSARSHLVALGLYQGLSVFDLASAAGHCRSRRVGAARSRRRPGNDASPS
jgi:hypothetical protein